MGPIVGHWRAVAVHDADDRAVVLQKDFSGAIVPVLEFLKLVVFVGNKRGVASGTVQSCDFMLNDSQ